MSGGIAKRGKGRLVWGMKRQLVLAFFVSPAMAAPPDLETWTTRMAGIVPEACLCRQASGPVTIDGRLDEKEWSGAAWTKDFVDIEGDLKPKPAFRTRVKMLWDQENLYIAVEMEEPQLWATMVKHDSVIFNDPDFEVFLDPDGDRHEYGEFEVNALNTTWDLFLPKPYREGGKAEDSWEISGLRSAVRLDGTLNDPSDQDRGWCIEIAMPWKSFSRLRHRESAPVEGEQWRVNFSRVEWQVEVIDGKVVKKPKTPEFNWVWSPQGVIDMHRPEMWGLLQFTKLEGEVAVKPEPARAARMLLMRVHHAQRDFFKARQRWAKSLEELGVSVEEKVLSAPGMRVTDDGYECEVTLETERWCIRQDGRISLAGK